MEKVALLVYGLSEVLEHLEPVGATWHTCTSDGLDNLRVRFFFCGFTDIQVVLHVIRDAEISHVLQSPF